MNSTARLAHSTVLITGASAGIGEATAHAFAREGARLLLAARRLDRLQQLAPQLEQSGASAVHALELDVRQNGSVQTAFAALPPEWQAIDILVNNAGLSRGLDKLPEAHPEDWDEMIDTNVKGLLYITRAVIPGMVERNRGHVISLGSTAGEMVYPGGAVYCATKAAEKSITEGLRVDLLGTAVRVTTVDPGAVETDFSRVRFKGDEARAAKVYQGITPLTPDDIAETIVWAATRPAHVNISRILLTSIDQANSLLFNRKPS
jgi:3-hydroxy acid dehydrogenase / malonic semialdehyde reductase